MSTSQPQSTFVYVDGFNLYRGVLRDGPYRWLDLFSLFKRLRNSENVIKVKYFTALVLGVERQRRQQIYLDALIATGVEVIRGNFIRKDVICTVNGCSRPRTLRKFQMPEEKRTDVNIAVNIVVDALTKSCTHQVLVSGDSDLSPAVEVARSSGSHVALIVPVADGILSHHASELRQKASSQAIALPLVALEQCQLPDLVQRPPPLNAIRKPAGW